MSLTWKQRDRKNFWINQTLILVFCGYLSLFRHMPLAGVALFLLVMELGAFVGAMWTTRLVGKFDRAKRDKFDLKVI